MFVYLVHCSFGTMSGTQQVLDKCLLNEQMNKDISHQGWGEKKKIFLTIRSCHQQKNESVWSRFLV